MAGTFSMFLVILVTLFGMFAIVLGISLQNSSNNCNPLLNRLC